MGTISQTIFSNAFSWMKILQLRLKFHWSLFPRDQSTIFQHWFRLWLSAVQATSHYLNQWWSVYRRIYASLGLNELMWPSDTMWCHGYWSTWIQVMAWCLRTPSHYLNQCWLIITKALRYSPEDNFTGKAQDIYPWYEFENYSFKITSTSPSDQWLNVEVLMHWSYSFVASIHRQITVKSLI